MQSLCPQCNFLHCGLLLILESCLQLLRDGVASLSTGLVLDMAPDIVWPLVLEMPRESKAFCRLVQGDKTTHLRTCKVNLPNCVPP
eukprot:6390751-Amphidinium_carterae.2